MTVQHDPNNHKVGRAKNNLLLMGFYRGIAEIERQYIETFNRWLKNI